MHRFGNKDKSVKFTVWNKPGICPICVPSNTQAREGDMSFMSGLEPLCADCPDISVPGHFGPYVTIYVSIEPCWAGLPAATRYVRVRPNRADCPVFPIHPFLRPLSVSPVSGLPVPSWQPRSSVPRRQDPIPRIALCVDSDITPLATQTRHVRYVGIRR